MKTEIVRGDDWSAEGEGDLLVVSAEEFERAVALAAVQPVVQAPVRIPPGPRGRQRKKAAR